MRIQCQEELIVSEIFLPALGGTSSPYRPVARWVALSLVVALPLASAPVRAQDNYPSKGITIIAPLAAGSAASAAPDSASSGRSLEAAARLPVACAGQSVRQARPLVPNPPLPTQRPLPVHVARTDMEGAEREMQAMLRG